MLRVTVNGSLREFEGLQQGATVTDLVDLLGFRQDRVALEQNGDIVPRTRWPQTLVNDGDRVELVQFVGGGAQGDCFAATAAVSTCSHCEP